MANLCAHAIQDYEHERRGKVLSGILLAGGQIPGVVAVRTMLRRGCLFIFMCTGLAHANPVVIQDLKDGLVLGPYLHIFEDKEGIAKWEDVIAGKHDAEFKAQNKAVPNFGSTRSVIWAVVDLEFTPPPAPPHYVERGARDSTIPSPRSGEGHAQAARGEGYLLELSHPILDYVDVWVLDAKGKILQSWQTGDLRPFDSRPIKHRNFLFPLSALTGARIFIRISTESSLSIPMNIWPKSTFAEKDMEATLFLGIYYGIIFVMVLYNLITAYAFKSLSGYLYVGYMFFLLLFQTMLDGIFYQAFPGLQYWNNLGITFWGNFSVAFGAWFAIQYLQIRGPMPKLTLALFIVGSIALLGALITPFFGYRFGSIINRFFGGTTGPFLLIVAGIWRYRQGYRPAKYFLAGYGILAISVIIYTLGRFGLFPSANFLVYHAMHFGSALEAILLSFGLADRIRLIQKEKELAQAATIEQQRILNEAFARFVPAPFLQILGKNSIPEVLLGDYTEREMTILFADIRGFTTISEKLSPKQTFDFINNYLQGSGPVIRNNGGFIDKYMGDGIMALFEKREDAIRAALRLQERNARLNRMLSPPSPGLDTSRLSSAPKGLIETPRHLTTGEAAGTGRGLIAPINVGIGIHTGHLMLGTIGEPQRMDGTVISDAVNLASRVESLTKQYGVDLLVTKETLAGMQLGTDERPYLRRFIDRIAVKGKSEPATVYEVVAVKNGKPVKYSEPWLTGWSDALKLYYSRDFGAALAALDSLKSELSDDKALKLFIARCRDYMHNPPPETWNGIAVAESK